MLLIFLAMAHSALYQPTSYPVRVMIRDTREIVRRSGDEIWPDYSDITLPVQLVEPTREVLFCGQRAAGFKAVDVDRVSGCGLQVRKRELPIDVAAASDLDNQQVIQIGLPSALGMSRSEWIVTLLHETFHQYQASLRGYNEAVSTVAQSLGQRGTDWILNYQFPYTDPTVVDAFADMNHCALVFLANRDPKHVARLVADYVRARHRAREAAGETAWQYYEFQVGQEGVARWTELKMARIAGHRDSRIAEVVADRWAGLSTSLRAISEQGINIWKRGSFYVFGAVEAEMLDQITPAWRHIYVRRPFTLGEQLDSAVG